MFTPAFRRFVWAGCALFAAAGTPACTLFGAVGEGMVEGGGTLAAKTRDEHPGPQRFDIAVPSKGYAYLGLFTGDKHRFNMGFNEKELFLARSTSGSLPRKERLRRFQNQVVTQTISRFIRRFIQILGMRVRGRQEQSDRIQTRYKPVIACGDGALRGRLENTLNYQEL